MPIFRGFVYVANLLSYDRTCRSKGLYSPTILKNILCLFHQDFQIGM